MITCDKAIITVPLHEETIPNVSEKYIQRIYVYLVWKASNYVKEAWSFLPDGDLRLREYIAICTSYYHLLGAK